MVIVLDGDLQPIAEWSCHVGDLSANGACLIAAEMPCEGDKLLVVLAPNAKSRGAAFFAKVAHVGLAEGEWIRIGVQFFHPPAQVLPMLKSVQDELILRSDLPPRTQPPARSVDEALDKLGRPHRKSA